MFYQRSSANSSVANSNVRKIDTISKMAHEALSKFHSKQGRQKENINLSIDKKLNKSIKFSSKINKNPLKTTQNP